MEETTSYLTLAGTGFALFLILLFLGIVRKSKTIFMLALVGLFGAVAFGCIAGFLFIKKSANHFEALMKPREGKEIYQALFDKPENCVEVVESVDQIIPILDAAIWLKVKTCPTEIERVLSAYDYSHESAATMNIIPLSSELKWTHQTDLGDSTDVYKYEIIPGKNFRTLWISKDSTLMYCRDVLD